MNRTFLLIGCLLLLSPLTAEIYKWTDENGVIHYGDRRPVDSPQSTPMPESEYISPPVGWLAPELPASTGDDMDAPTTDYYYQGVEILSPAHEETVRDAPGNVEIRIATKPGLRSGDAFQIYLNGKRVYEPFRYTNVIMPTVDRGEHRIQVVIVDENGKSLIKSAENTFYLHRHFKKPAPAAPPPPVPQPSQPPVLD